MFQFANSACKAVIEGDEIITTTKQEKEVLAFLESLYNEEEKKVIIWTEIPHVAFRESDEDPESVNAASGTPDQGNV